MKKHFIYVLTAALILSLGFGVKKQLQVNSLTASYVEFMTKLDAVAI